MASTVYESEIGVVDTLNHLYRDYTNGLDDMRGLAETQARD